MKKKAQMNLGWFLVIAISIIVGLVLLNPIANQVTGSTSTENLINVSKTASTTDVELVGYQDVVGTYILTNATSGATIPTSNATLVTSTSNGDLRLYLHLSDSRWNSKVINISGTLEQTGYIKEGAGRQVTLLITIMTVLAIAVFSIPNIREYFDF